MSATYRVFRGLLYAVGFKPDGDTVSFRPHDAAAMAALPDADGNIGGVEFDADKNGAVSVRLQGLDALETHYQPVVVELRPAGVATPAAPKPSVGNHHQRLDLSRAAANALLGMLGVVVTASDWHSWGYLRRVSVGGVVIDDKFKENVEIVVVSDGTDTKGRVLGFVFPGSVALTEGQVLSEAELVALVKTSCNGQMLNQGLAWPYFYMTLASDVRGRLSYYAGSAQRYGRGVWPLDSTRTGAAVSTVTALNDAAVLMPYLFRKLLRSWRADALATWWAGGDVSDAALEGLDVGRLFASGDPYVYTVSDRQFLRLSQILSVDGGVLRMSRKAQDVVFLE